MRLTKFGAVDLPTYNADDQFSNEAHAGLVELDNSAADIWGDRLAFKPRPINRTFEIWATDTETITEQIDELLTEFAKGRRMLRGVTRDGVTRQTWAKVDSVSYSRRRREIGFQNMNVTFLMDYPFWLDADDEPVYLDDGYILDGTWDLQEGNWELETITSSPHNFSITNGGDARVVKGYIRLVLDGTDTITNPRITNSTTGQWVQYTGSLTTGDVLDYDLLAQTVRLNSELVNDDVTMSDTNQWLMELELGSNSISVTGTGIAGSLSLEWQWSKHYP